MSNRVELFLKLALAAKTAAEVAPVTPAPMPPVGPADKALGAGLAPIKPIGEADLQPGPLNTKHMNVTPGSPGTEVPGIKPVGPNDLAPGDLNVQPAEPQATGTPAWLNSGLNWAKGFGQNPMNWDKSHMLAAGGVGAGALLMGLMHNRKKKRQPKMAATNILRRPMLPADAATAIQSASKHPNPRLSTTQSLVRPDLAKAGPGTTRDAITSAAGRPHTLSPTDAIQPITTKGTTDIKPEMAQTGAFQTGKITEPETISIAEARAASADKPTALEGDAEPHVAPMYQTALEKTPPGGTARSSMKTPPAARPTDMTAGPSTSQGTASGLVPNPRASAEQVTEQIPVSPAPSAGLGKGPAAALAGGAAAAGAAGGAAAMSKHDANQTAAANPIGADIPQTATGNAAGGAGDWIQKYVGGFNQSPTQWDASHMLAGGGAAAALAYLLMHDNNDDE